jgi:pyrimidine operon attenuation protein/uracil phosphoribosyltransferase
LITRGGFEELVVGDDVINAGSVVRSTLAQLAAACRPAFQLGKTRYIP